jgi:hypothetical protein
MLRSFMRDPNCEDLKCHLARIPDCLATYVEKKLFDEIDDERIIQQYQNMHTRRTMLLH